MKKVLILANSSGGLYDFRKDLVRELLKQYEVVASLPDEVRTQNLIDEGVRIIKTDIDRRGMNPKKDFSLFREYRRLIREEKPDIIITYTIKPNIYGGFAARLAGVPYISTITGLGSGFYRNAVLRKMIVTMYKAALKKASCVFFQNSENMHLFEQYGIVPKNAESKPGTEDNADVKDNADKKGKAGRKSKVTTRLVNGSGVDLEAHQILEFPSEENGVQILFIGRNMREKGTDELLECTKRLADNKEVAFKLLGYSDDDYDEIIKDYESRGYFTTHPFDTDVNKHLKECSAVILPSRSEGMSNVLQEAAAVGRMVIATDIPGCREVFEEGVTGFGAKLMDVDSLVQAVLKCLSLSRAQREAMGLKGREKMEREFDRKIITKAYLEEIYRYTV